MSRTFATGVVLAVIVGFWAAPLFSQTQTEPRLPVIDFDACGSPDPRFPARNPPSRLEADDRMYSSWEDNRTLISNIPRGTEVTRVGAVNITREADQGVLTGVVDESLRPLVQGDEVLGYGLHSNSRISFWGKGVSFTEHYENIASKGLCGFRDKTQCHINIVKSGVQEWWIQLRTTTGLTGWILGRKQVGDDLTYGPNAGYACRD